MQNYRLSEFDSIVKTLSGRYQRDSLNDSDDIEQELKIKLVETLPHLQTIPRKEIKTYVTSMLRNEIRSIQRKSVTRAPFNCKLEYVKRVDELDTFSWEDAADRAMMAMKTYIPEHFTSPEDNCAYSLLATHMVNWAEAQGGRTAILINEMLNPSDRTLMMWREMVAKFPTYKKFECMPPSSFAKILGYSKLSIHKIILNLRFYLVTVGYNEDYVNNHLFNPKPNKKRKRAA